MWQGPGAQGIHEGVIGLPRAIYLRKVQPVPKISLIWGKCVPIRTFPMSYTFSPVKLSHHYQVPSKSFSIH